MKKNRSFDSMFNSQRSEDRAGHTARFYQKKFSEYNEYAANNNLKRHYNSWQEVASIWYTYKVDNDNCIRKNKKANELNSKKGVINIDKQMKYALQYDTNYSTARAELRTNKSRIASIEREIEIASEAGDTNKVKSLGAELDEIKSLTLEELKLMGTQEFADRHKGFLMDEYARLKKLGYSGKEAKKQISAMYFGS